MKPGGRGELVLMNGNVYKGTIYVHGSWVTLTEADGEGGKIRTTYPVHEVYRIRWSSS